LNDACALSDKEYDEGGMSYLYKFGHGIAQTHEKRQVIEDLRSQSTTTFSDSELVKIRYFFEEALCRFAPQSISHETDEYVKKLLSHLYTDFTGMPCKVASNEKDGAWSTLQLIFLDKNDYHDIDVFWSVD